jgi:hypothetical protein
MEKLNQTSKSRVQGYYVSVKYRLVIICFVHASHEDALSILVLLQTGVFVNILSHKLYQTRNAYTIKHINIDQWWHVWDIVYVTKVTSWIWCLDLFDCWTMLVAKVNMLIRSQKESAYHIFASLFCSSILLSLKTYLSSKLYVFLPVSNKDHMMPLLKHQFGKHKCDKWFQDSCRDNS